MKRLAATLLLACGLFGAWAPARSLAEEAGAKRPRIVVESVTQDNQKLIGATVTLDGNPVAGANVRFLVKRTFGDMEIGKDVTFDDGTAFVPFPSDLPGGPEGRLDVTVRVTAPPSYAGALGQATLPGARAVQEVSEPFPRTLWAPQPPVTLVAVIAALVVGVWATYAYVVLQVLRIRKGKGP
jgi:hypothetical protein